jgi:hypothetical protein
VVLPFCPLAPFGWGGLVLAADCPLILAPCRGPAGTPAGRKHALQPGDVRCRLRSPFLVVPCRGDTGSGNPASSL